MQFSGPGEEKLKHAAATFCSNQPFALEMIKSRQKKDSRFQTFVQVSSGCPVREKIVLPVIDSKPVFHKSYIYVNVF